MNRFQTDVLVIGSGGAGLMAAYEATKHTSKVSIVNKGKMLRTGSTVMAPGGISGVDDRWKMKEDSKELLIRDTIKGGNYLNNQSMVEILAKESPELILELERMGALFQREEDGQQYMLRVEGHSYPRCPYLEDRTGREMTRAMMSELKRRDVYLHENIIITRIIEKEGKVAGAVGLDLRTFEPVLFECKSIILATGGGGSIYENTDNSPDITGDGLSLALEAGASLQDMEFVQFYPLGFLFPLSLKGMLAGLLDCCRLYNAKGERFMEKYDPERLELSTRDVISRAILQEVEDGNGSPLGGVYLDLTFNEPGFIKQRTPGLYETYMNIGIDPEKDMIEIAPTVHFFMGGLKIDTKWETSVGGLFGAGEVCGGMHGGNRLSQNALAELLVSGSIAGRNASLYANKNKLAYINPLEMGKEEDLVTSIMSNKEGESPRYIRKELKKAMTKYAGAYRTEENLFKALKILEDLENTPVKTNSKDKFLNKEILEAIENKNMFTVSKCIILSALERKESRGGHFRSDYPKTDNKDFLFNSLISKKNEKLILGKEDVDLTIVKVEV